MTWNKKPFHEIHFAVNKSIRYHARLRDCFRTVHNWIKVSNAFAASGAFVAVLGSLQQLSVFLTALIAFATFIDLMLGFEKKANVHSELCAEFSNLAARLEMWDTTEENLRKAKSTRIKIEAKDPDDKRLVEIFAHNEEARGRGCSEEELLHLGIWQRRLGCFVTFGMPEIEKKKREREGPQS